MIQELFLDMMNCNLCNSHKTKNIYTPIQSKIDLTIDICKKCGHVFGSFDELKFEAQNKKNCDNKFTHLSCEADYSEIRVGKQQMVDYFFNAFEQLNTQKQIKSVLDVKSARGDFALKALDYFGLSSIDCIEEDEYMTDTYRHNPKVNISHKKYYYSFESKEYDLVYSCHSLEHYQNPKKVLTYIHQKVKDGGLFYVDVPNLDILDDQLNIDDFFYDKHLHFFTSDLIIKFIENLGFKLLINNTTSKNIGLLFQKSSDAKLTAPILNYYEFNKSLIKRYKKNLKQNRKSIKHNTQHINAMFTSNKSNVIIGCGRALDAMIKYGNLDIGKFKYFVDDFLIKATDTIYDRKLVALNDINHIDGVLLLVKNPEKILEKLNHVKTVITYNAIFK